METLYNVTITKFTGPIDNNSVVHVFIAPNKKYEIRDSSASIKYFKMHNIQVSRRMYNYNMFIQLYYSVLANINNQVDIDVMDNVVIGIRRTTLHERRRHMAAFKIQIYWRLARQNPKYLLAHKLQWLKI